MILSKEDMFSDGQAITASTVSTNVIDFGASGSWIHGNGALIDDKGNSEIPLLIQVTEDFDNLTSLTVGFEVDDDEAFGSSTVLYEEIILLAALAAGRKTSVRSIPANFTERYARIKYTVTGIAPTIGKVTAAIAESGSTWGAR